MEPSSAQRATRAVLLLLLVSLPLALLAAVRFDSPDSLDAAWMPWVAIGLASTAGLAALSGLVRGLRGGMIAPLLQAGASAAVAGGTIGGLASLSTPLVGAAAFLVAAALADRFGAMVHGRLTRIGAAAAVLIAAEALVLAGVLPTAAAMLTPLHAWMLGLTAAGALLAAALGAGRPIMLIAASLAVGATALAVAGGEGVEQLIGLLALIGSQIIGLHALLHEGPETDTSPEERGLPELASRLSDAVLRFDGRLQLREWNVGAAQMLGLDDASAGSRLEDLLGVSIAELPTRDGVVTREGAVGGLEINLHRSGDGLTAIVKETRSTPETERLGRELRGTIEELLQSRRTVELQRTEIERASTVDELTGVASRSAVLDRLRVEMAQARRYSHPIAVVLLDIDHFAELNRLHGITGGDAILREVALRIRLRVREADALGRAGSDSFLAILPHTDETGAAIFADAVRHRLGRRVIGVGDAQVAITLSIGVALMREGEDLDVDALLARVDEALASARGAGGDRIALDRLHGLARLDEHRPAGMPDEVSADDGS